MPHDDDHDSSFKEMHELLRSVDSRLDALLLNIRFAALGSRKQLEFLYRDKLVNMYLPFADVDFIQRNILIHRTFYEVKALQKVMRYITHDSVVLDAGSNIGNHTVFFSKICGAKEVLAFEVMHETFKILERNIKLNGLSNVRAFNLGLGAVRGGRARLAHFEQHNIGGASIEHVDGDGVYNIVTVDSLGLGALHFIKIDVEGTFLPVLDGARETIARCKPRIWLELRRLRGERAPGEDHLRKLGYKVAKELSPNDVLFEPD